jgi:hypothetical protein
MQKIYSNCGRNSRRIWTAFWNIMKVRREIIVRKMPMAK